MRTFTYMQIPFFHHIWSSLGMFVTVCWCLILEYIIENTVELSSSIHLRLIKGKTIRVKAIDSYSKK